MNLISISHQKAEIAARHRGYRRDYRIGQSSGDHPEQDADAEKAEAEAKHRLAELRREEVAIEERLMNARSLIAKAEAVQAALR